uniref:signal peptidase II n=1 Tax=uncultured Desulfovibrio sp. TaxID=167968 RepID=UPI0026025B80
MTRERGAAARWRLLLGTAAALLALDQASKLLVMACIPEHRPVPVIPGVFDLVNIRNRGAAFGFLNRSDIEWQFWLFLVATLVAIWAIVVLARSTRRPLLLAGLGL